MTSAAFKSRLLTIADDQELLDSIPELMKDNDHIEVLDPTSIGEDLMEGIESLHPEYILLDHSFKGADTLKLIDSITAQFPDIIVVVVLSTDQLADSTSVILAGARAFILKPIKKEELESTLDRVRELVTRSMPAPQEVKVQSRSSTSGTYVVFSPKGGAGSSSVAVNLSLSLLEQLEQEVLLMDGKFMFGHLDMFLNLRTQNTVSDLIAHVNALDQGLIRDVISEHVSGLSLLPGPGSFSAGQGIKPEDLFSLLTDLQVVFPYIVIDGGNYLNDNLVTMMDASNKVLLVVNPDITSLRDASQFFEVSRSLAYPKDKVQVVVNKLDKRDGLTVSDIEKTLEVEVLASIPYDRKASVNSINRGVPISLQRQRSPIRKAYQALAGNLISRSSAHASQGGQKSVPDALSKSSRLG